MTLVEELFPGRRYADLNREERAVYMKVYLRRRDETDPTFKEERRKRIELWHTNHPDCRRIARNRRIRTFKIKARLLDELLPILQSGDAKALDKLRRKLARMAKAVA